jgi:transmembrane sensor
MSSEETRPASEAIEAAAAAWLSLRDRGMTPAEAAEFVQWLQQDARHAEVFGELDRTWRDFDRLSAVPAPAAQPDPDLLVPRPRPAPRRAGAWAALAAAAAVAVLATVLMRTPGPTAETLVGAFQKLDLPDGSVVQLNTDTAIATTFTAAQRHVRILRGEAYFAVAKDAARPFVVTVGPVAVRAVGTAFNVRQRDAAVEVLVTEGQVRVDDARAGRSVLAAASTDPAGAPPYLEAGERIRVPASAQLASPARVEKVSEIEVRRALAWQERRLEFESASLDEIVREFNRYNRRQLVVADTALAAKRFSGTFRADGYASLVRLLETDFGVAVETREDRLILRAGR